MPMSDIKPQQSANPIHRIHPVIKLALAITFIVVISLISSTKITRLIPVGFFLALFILLAEVPLLRFIRHFLTLSPFVVLAGISLPFTTPGTVAGTVPLLGWHWTWEGWHSFLILFARSSLSFITLILLSLITNFPSLMGALRRMKMPMVLINSLELLYRYLFVLRDEGSRMMRARQSRYLGKKPFREPAILGRMVGTLWIRSYLRAERVAQAMEARGGLGGHLLSIQHRPVAPGEWALLLISVIFCAAIVFLPVGFFRL
jgi:cobalt/nickel transport system permease protein